MSTPIYDAVARDLDWSPDELGEPFDLAGALTYGRLIVAERARLRAALYALVGARRGAVLDGLDS